MWISSHDLFPDHEHTLTAGQNTKPAGHYREKFAKAVVKGHKAMRKGRKHIWDSLTVEIRGGVEQGHGEHYGDQRKT